MGPAPHHAGPRTTHTPGPDQHKKGGTSMTEHPTGGLTAEHARHLPAVLDPATAGRLLGIGRTTAYRLLETGTFPAPAFRAGKKWRIPTSGICRLLGIAYPPPGPCAHGSPATDHEQDQ